MSLFHGRRGLVPLLLLLLLALAPRPVLAHASLVASEPADGAVLAEAPAGIALRFDEPLQLLALSLLDQRGTARNLTSAARVESERISVALPEQLPDGGYLLSWRGASLDGHVVAGTLAFTVGVAAGSGPVLHADDWRWAGYAFRLAARLAVLLAAGAALFLLLVARPDAPLPLDRGARVAARLAVAVVLPAFAAMGAERAGLAPLELWSGAAWTSALDAPSLWAWGACLAALAMLAFVRQPVLRLGAALVAPCLLAGSGHGLVAWPGIGQALMWLHGLAAAAWIGALWPLRWSLGHSAEAPRLFRRFQSLGLVAVLAVFASGIALAVAILPSVAVLWSSDYGLRLSAKLLLVAAMLAIAAANRLCVTRTALGPAGRPRARTVLRRLLGLDIVVALGVVALAAGLSLDPPPANATKLSFAMHHAGGSVTVTLVPGRVGDNAAQLDLKDREGRPFETKEVTLRIAAPDAGVAPITVGARALGDGRWAVDRLTLWIPGPWEVEAALLVDDFTLVKARTTVSLAP